MSTKGLHAALAALAIVWIGLLAGVPAVAASWYFAPNGSDAAGNGSRGMPWLDPSFHNAQYQPGDVLDVAPGIYRPRWGWFLTASGSAAGGYITLRCAPQHRSMIRVDTPYMMGILVTHGGAFWTIDGCDVSATGTDGSAVAIGGGFSAPFGALHHIVVTNNIAHDSACGGIAVDGAGNGDQALDYVILRGNIVYGNAGASARGCSGVSIAAPAAYDQAPGYHLLIQRNIVYDNSDCAPCHPVTRAGDGVALRDFRHSQTPGQPYAAASLIENNLTFDNGGSGIGVVLSDNVRVRNNTAWGDVRDDRHCDGGYEIGAVLSSHVAIVDNIAATVRSTVCRSRVIALFDYGGGLAEGDAIDWNIAHGLAGADVADDGAAGFAWGPHNQIGSDPMLAGPVSGHAPIAVSQIVAAFVPRSASPALRHGTVGDSPETDLVGTPRRTAAPADLGAIQVGP
jgi:hypothetical protein